MFSLVIQNLKVDKTNRKENNGADSQSDSQSSVSDSPSTAPPPLHRSQEFPRKGLEPFHLHSFPKVRESLDQYALYQALCVVSVNQPPEQSVGLRVDHQRAPSTNKLLGVGRIDVFLSDFTAQFKFVKTKSQMIKFTYY